MKVGIICFWDRTATPYLEKYEEMLYTAGIEFEVIFWNRTGKANCTAAMQHEKEILLRCRNSRLGKILDFYRWRNLARIELKRARFDYLIVLSTMPAVLLADYLFKYYSERYLFDIRDYTMESNPIFSKLVTNLVECSDFTTISSTGYLQWLKPSNKIVPNHNFTSYPKEYDKFIRIKNASKLRFTFVGNIRLDRQTEAALLQLKESNRYISGFVGRVLPSCKIHDFCRKNSINNVYFHGEFKGSEKAEIYKQVDLINAIYANSSNDIRLADSTPLPNRVYDAALYKCPIVASKGTYLADVIREYDLGFSVDGFAPNLEGQFNEYIDTFDERKFRAGCERFLEYALKEEAGFKSRFQSSMDRNMRRYPASAFDMRQREES